MSAWLLDVNVLFALSHSHHPHNPLTELWFRKNARHGWATCGITQIAFIRLSLNPQINPHRTSPAAIYETLMKMTDHPLHHFWCDPRLGLRTLSFKPSMQKVDHHSRVTDAYLVGLAMHHHGYLATFDQEVVSTYPKIARLITWNL